MADAPQQRIQPPTIHHLRTITARIKEILLEATTKRFWVRAHLISNRAGLRAGHFYCELVETDERGRQVAKISAVVWKASLDAINRKLQLAGLENALQGNKEICALCSVDYHEVYGLKLLIHDVDPTFGEAQIDQNRRLILERLKADQLLEKNKAVKVPAAILRIGLITADKSAAYSDFTKTLSASPFAFKVILASASMQGERVEDQVLTAIHDLLRLGVEAICIVRGGGSQVDLAWFDNEKIARAIAAAPIPVWVGIGHEIDVGVLDFVAHTHFKTPTAVAEALVNRLQDLHDRLTIADDRLQDLVDRQLTLATRNLQRNVQGLLQGVRKHLELNASQLELWLSKIRVGIERAVNLRDSRLQERTGHLQSTIRHLLREKAMSLEATVTSFKTTSDQRLRGMEDLLKQRQRQFRLVRYKKRLDVALQTLESQRQRLENLRPERMLRRGYSITRDAAGNLVKSISDVKAGEKLSTQLVDGIIGSVVNQTEE